MLYKKKSPKNTVITIILSLWRYTEFHTWKKSRNSVKFRGISWNYRTRNSGEFRRNFSQFRTEYGIDGSKKNRRNSVSTEFRGHPKSEAQGHLSGCGEQSGRTWSSFLWTRGTVGVCCPILHYPVLSYTIEYYPALSSTTLHYRVLSCTTYLVLPCTIVYYPALPTQSYSYSPLLSCTICSFPIFTLDH